MKVTMHSNVSNYILPFIIAGILLLIAGACLADEKSVYDDKNHHYDHQNTINGINGQDGVGIKGDTGAAGLNGTSYSSSVFNRAMAITGAMTAIPASSHVDEGHGHTMFGAGVGGYADSQGAAVGITHMQGRLSGKATIGISGSERIYGIGGGFTF